MRDLGQPLVGIGDPDILRLPAVDAAAKGPAAAGIGAVVDPAVSAEKAGAAEGFHIDGHPVSGAEGTDVRACLLHHAYHLVSHRDAGHRPGNRAVLDVQIAGADAGQRDPDDRVPGVQQDRLWLVQQGEFPPLQIGVGEHGSDLLCFEMDEGGAGSERRCRCPCHTARRNPGRALTAPPGLPIIPQEEKNSNSGR